MLDSGKKASGSILSLPPHSKIVSSIAGPRCDSELLDIRKTVPQDQRQLLSQLATAAGSRSSLSQAAALHRVAAGPVGDKSVLLRTYLTAVPRNNRSRSARRKNRSASTANPAHIDLRTRLERLASAVLWLGTDHLFGTDPRIHAAGENSPVSCSNALSGEHGSTRPLCVHARLRAKKKIRHDTQVGTCESTTRNRA